MRQQVEARVFHRDRAAEQLAQRPADLVDALAVQHQLGETAVDVHGALQAPVLGVDDPLEQRRHQVRPGDFLRDREQRQRVPVGLFRHLGGGSFRRWGKSERIRSVHHGILHSIPQFQHSNVSTF